ncbi:hypothetical protein AOPFMNJM_1512 [Methylobacterium jeotgali]|uniref:Uncharacterized protein n=1 Tax=Methylobacterium jeotgali TaxID=381630 RepID=A0ABQ4SWE5_9HYPH|nr:hypothetical protein AOPFMNJM_1512 [Methylobacterium jeotgali]
MPAIVPAALPVAVSARSDRSRRCTASLNRRVKVVLAAAALAASAVAAAVGAVVSRVTSRAAEPRLVPTPDVCVATRWCTPSPLRVTAAEKVPPAPTFAVPTTASAPSRTPLLLASSKIETAAPA